MLVTSKNVPFPGYHLLTTSTDDLTLVLYITLAGAWVIIKVPIVSRWLYDLEIGHFYKSLAWWLPSG